MIHEGSLFLPLKNYLQRLKDVVINTERIKNLDLLCTTMLQKNKEDVFPNLNFICTHNSRRSTIAQIWAKTMAFSFDLPIDCFSGGVEITAFNLRAVKAMRRAGFQIIGKGSDNPIYSVAFTDAVDPLNTFSKKFDDPSNPSSKFIAVMTCAHADENCPVIYGAEARIPVRYVDPKIADDTPEESETYDARVLQIGAEMHYLFKSLAQNLNR